MMKKLLPLLFFLLLPAVAEAYKSAKGTYTGNGLDDRNIVISATTSPSITDFQPDMCFVKGVGRTPWLIRMSSMPAGQSGGLTAQAFLTNHLQTLNATGFQVGTNADINNSGTVYHYACFEGTSTSDAAVGSYTGNGTSQSITISPSFQPAIVWVVSTNQGTSWRGDTAHSGTANSSNHSNAVEIATCLTATNVNGFSVGSSAGCNSSGVTYYYFALKANTGIATGNYTGNNVDGRTITAGFQPEFALIKVNAGVYPAIRFLSMGAGDISCTTAVTHACATANYIQTFAATGVTVGTDAVVNSTGGGSPLYRWFAIKQPAVGGTTVLHRRVQ